MMYDDSHRYKPGGDLFEDVQRERERCREISKEIYKLFKEKDIYPRQSVIAMMINIIHFARRNRELTLEGFLKFFSDLWRQENDYQFMAEFMAKLESEKIEKKQRKRTMKIKKRACT